MDNLNQRFGTLLQEKRKERKLTQEELARRIGLGRTSVTNIEKGRQPVTLQLLFDLAKVLALSPADLLPDMGQWSAASLQPGNLIDESGHDAIQKVLTTSLHERN